MSEHIEFVVRVPKGEADYFIARFGKENVKILGFLLGEEIVRCRDCKWFTPEEIYEEYRDFAHSEIMVKPPSCGNPERCNKHYDSATGKYVPVHTTTQPDGFCAWGEPRGDA